VNKNKTGQGRWSGSSSKEPALQAQGPKFKLQYYKKIKRERERKNHIKTYRVYQD
jgi:hypothetical protein